jgi:hypothetical protein
VITSGALTAASRQVGYDPAPRQPQPASASLACSFVQIGERPQLDRRIREALRAREIACEIEADEQKKRAKEDEPPEEGK